MIDNMWRLGLLAVVAGIGAGCSSDSGPKSRGPGSGPARPAELVTSRPLPNRPAVAGKRFARLDPAATGLSFRNDLLPENIVGYVYMGAGLTVGDYDQDGRQDLYLVSQDGPNKLFRQTAPLKFEDVTKTAGLGLDGGDAWGTAATFADVDGDADLDLYVCNLESPNLLFLNQGDGTFVEKAGAFGLGATYASTGAAFADYDNDGDLDLYLLTNRVFRANLHGSIVGATTVPSRVKKSREQLLAKDLTFSQGDHTFQAGQQDRLFRNDGYARFVEVTDEAGLDDHGNGLSVVWWDFDGDGYQDIYVANDFQSPDQLYHNRGDGTFADVTKERLPHTAFFGMGSDFGDINNDLLMDLCVADMSSTTHYMGKMLMGSMDQHRWFLMNSDPQQYMRNAVYLNSGTKRFCEAAYLTGLASTDWTWTVRFADLDEDGREDFYATNGIPVFSDNPDIAARVTKLWEDGQRQAAIEVMRNMPRVDEKNIARKNLGNLEFADVGAEWGLDESGVTHGAVVIDLDGDGDLDIVTNNLNAEASVFENRTAGSHRMSVRLHAANGNHHGVGASIDLEAGGMLQTRQVSLTRGYMSGGNAVVHFGLGDVDNITRLEVHWPSGRRQLVDDLKVDMLYEIWEDDSLSREPVMLEPLVPLFVADKTPAVHQERDFDDFAAQPLLPHRLSRLGPGIACGDIDGDGDDDVWCGGAAGQAGTLLRNDDGKFAPVDGPWQADANCEDLGSVFVDVDSDGDLDLFVGSGGVEAGDKPELLRDRLYVNDGTGTFARAAADVLPVYTASTSAVCAADYDRDGDLDLFIGCRVVPGRFPHAGPSYLLRNDDGKFVDASKALKGLAALGMVSSACWTDLDDDGFVDLVVASQWQPIRVFHNDGGRTFVEQTQDLQLEGLRGQWNGIAAGDLDGDGDIDLVATNLGLNSKYHASADKPMELFARDFDGNGTFDVIEAKHSGGKVLPVRGLSCSSGAMPFVREKFSTYDSFARATLGQIYGTALQECLTLSCTELQHVVLENKDGVFVARPLPRAAQISAGFGVLIRDFDGDGHQDLFLAHNFFSPEPETGRIDGGLSITLYGDGKLQFEPRMRDVALPGDSKAVAALDCNADGAVDLLVSANDGPLQVLLSSGKPLMGVRLRGVAGNPTGIGAQVTLQQGDLRSVRELQAGASYLAQSAPVVWFAGAKKGDTLIVRWPDGKKSEHKVEQTAGVVTLQR